MRKTIKQSLLYFLTISITIIFSSCGFIEPGTDGYIIHFNTPTFKAEKALGYIENGDAESLREMFCERIKNSPDLDDKIQEAIDLLDGTVLSYETIGGSGEGKWSRKGNKVDEHGKCHDIVTDTGKVYFLSMRFYTENDFEPDLLGLYYFAFSELKENPVNNDWFSDEVIIGDLDL